MFTRLYGAWKRYRYRFVPWIAPNLKNRTVRQVKQKDDDFHCTQVFKQLLSFLITLDQELKANLGLTSHVYAQHHLHKSFTENTHDLHDISSVCSLHTLGFQINKCISKLGMGDGVVVTAGRIARGSLVALYPGLLYEKAEPVFFQSLNNKYMFRCVDGLLVDGNDRSISRILYRSCAGREILGPHMMCDISWIATHPINCLAVGQYINNQNRENPANVAYRELTLSDEFPFELLKYLPNIYYSPHHHFGTVRQRRLVVLTSLRDIQQGEELFSTYFTLVYK